jgi:hypothetical protein
VKNVDDIDMGEIFGRACILTENPKTTREQVLSLLEETAIDFAFLNSQGHSDDSALIEIAIKCGEFLSGEPNVST